MMIFILHIIRVCLLSHALHSKVIFLLLQENSGVAPVLYPGISNFDSINNFVSAFTRSQTSKLQPKSLFKKIHGKTYIGKHVRNSTRELLLGRSVRVFTSFRNLVGFGDV